MRPIKPNNHAGEHEKEQTCSAIKGIDAYFGAPDARGLLEEFGFVPAVNTNDLEHEEPGSGGEFVIHSNEYNVMQQLFRNNENNAALKPAGTVGQKRLPLVDISNTLYSELDGQCPAKYSTRSFQLLSIDEQLSEELAKVVQDLERPPPIITHTMPIKRRKQVPASDTFFDSKFQEQRKRHPQDLYTPRVVRGTGMNREGLCEICSPGVWLKIKQSAYWYHMNFIHGVSAATGRPYEPPQSQRQKIVTRMGGELVTETEGLCAYCEQWVFMVQESVVDRGSRDNDKEEREAAGNSVWWRHLQKCISKHVNMPKRTNVFKRALRTQE